MSIHGQKKQTALPDEALPYDPEEWNQRLAEARARRAEVLRERTRQADPHLAEVERAHRQTPPIAEPAAARPAPSPDVPYRLEPAHEMPRRAAAPVSPRRRVALSFPVALAAVVAILLAGIALGIFLSGSDEIGLSEPQDVTASRAVAAPPTPAALPPGPAEIGLSRIQDMTASRAAAAPPTPAALSPEPDEVGQSQPQDMTTLPAVAASPTPAALPPEPAPQEDAPGPDIGPDAASRAPQGTAATPTKESEAAQPVPASSDSLAEAAWTDARAIVAQTPSRPPQDTTASAPPPVPETDATDTGADVEFAAIADLVTIVDEAIAESESVSPDKAIEPPPDTVTRVVLHVPPSVPRSIRDGISDILRDGEWPIEAPRASPYTIRDDQVRYFHAGDRAGAEQLAAQLSADVRDFTSFRPRPDRGLLEIWLSGRAPPVKRARPTDPVTAISNMINRAFRGVQRPN